MASTAESQQVSQAKINAALKAAVNRTYGLSTTATATSKIRDAIRMPNSRRPLNTSVSTSKEVILNFDLEKYDLMHRKREE